MHAQTVDTRPLFPPPTWPGYKATDDCKFKVYVDLAVVFGEMDEPSHTVVGVKTGDIPHSSMSRC